MSDNWAAVLTAILLDAAMRPAAEPTPSDADADVVPLVLDPKEPSAADDVPETAELLSDAEPEAGKRGVRARLRVAGKYLLHVGRSAVDRAVVLAAAIAIIAAVKWVAHSCGLPLK